ncbi:MAG: hypothetical protein QOH21_3571, partial [Acidobacteriota bacterium]|nr:hypothetical protein [Acidobacteriota bacterium]
MSPTVLDFDELLQKDADDVSRQAVALSPADKIAAIRRLAEAFDGFANVERLKALLFFQAALASLPANAIPAGTARMLVNRVARVATGHDRFVRQAALQVLALVVL